MNTMNVSPLSPTIKIIRDPHFPRSVVLADGERIGFVRRCGKLWNACNATMEYSTDRATKEAAIEWLVALSAPPS